MWPQVVGVIVGVWLMAAPSRLNLGQVPSNHEHIVGPILAAAGLVSMAEVTRGARWLVLATGLWLIAGPFVLGYWAAETTAGRNEIICGACAAGAALFRGRIRRHRGGGWGELIRQQRGRSERKDKEES